MHGLSFVDGALASMYIAASVEERYSPSGARHGMRIGGPTNALPVRFWNSRT